MFRRYLWNCYWKRNRWIAMDSYAARHSIIGSYNIFVVKTEAAGLSEILVTTYQIIKSQIPEDNNLISHITE
jgi:hypothetical protein